MSAPAAVSAATSTVPARNLTIAHVCLANAGRDEKSETHRYGKRHAQFLHMFAHTFRGADRPDVVSIKELRTCKSESGKFTFSAHEIVMDYARMGGYAIASCDPVKLGPTKKHDHYDPFHLAQLYDPKRLVKITAHAFRNYRDIYYAENPFDAPGHGACCLEVEYQPIVDGVPDGKNVIRVTTHHFPMDGPSKLRAAQASNALVRSNGSHVNIGDYNLFRDDKERDAIYGELTRVLKDATVDLVNQHGAKMYGTFYPFPADKPPVEISPPDQDSPNASRLDYAFVSSNVKVQKAWVLHGLKDDTGVEMSDHLPLLLKMSY